MDCPSYDYRRNQEILGERGTVNHVIKNGSANITESVLLACVANSKEDTR